MPDQPAAIDLNVGTKPVDERHGIDRARLEAWLKDHVPGFEGPLELRQFNGGQSNPTYQLITPSKRYVLRRKPPGKLLPSAHAVDREFRVICALAAVDFPVPHPHALCRDDDVAGTMFYVMDHVEGRIFWDSALHNCPPEQRRRVCAAEVEALARLHTLDYAAIGLADFGKTGNYFARQIDRWSRQYRASETTKLDLMDRLMDWLPLSTPADDDTALVHGDFRVDNAIFHPTEPTLRAVLDWELSTLGNPLADFTYFLLPWVLPPDEHGSLTGIGDLAGHGLPTVEALVADYCRLTGRAGLPALDWYFAYNLFRLAGICQGIAGRIRDGTASSSHAAQMQARVPKLVNAAWSYAQKAGAP